MKKNISSIGVVVLLSLFSCSKQTEKKSTVFQSNNNRINLQLDSKSIMESDTVELFREKVFESNKEVFLDGFLWKTKVDNENNVYIAVQRLGKLAIYVFHPDGRLKNKVSRYGRGPGEFEYISSMTVYKDTLLVLDTRLQKIGFFSLNDLSHIKDELIDNSKIKREGKFESLMKGRDIYVIDADHILMKFEVLSLFEPNMFTKSVSYRISNDGIINSKPILQQDRYIMYTYKDKGNTREFGFTTPFTRNSLFTLNDKGEMFTAWSEDFLIKKYNREGIYQKSFYYPFQKSNLSLEALDLDRRRVEFIKEQGYPKTWPVLHTMEADDEGRLWIAIITDNDSTYQWVVLDQEDGSLLAKFTFSGKRSEISPFASTNLTIIKNGYFYNREYNYEDGIDRIVKYKIVFKER